MKLKERFKECIENLDFDRIEECMKLLGRTWGASYAGTVEHYPNRDEMIECCERLFKSAEENYKKSGEESYSSTGGFQVYVDEGYVSVEFVLTEWQSF